MFQLEYPSFRNLFLSGNKVSIDKSILRTKLGQQISALLGSPDFDFKTVLAPDQFEEFATKVEEITGESIRKNSSFLEGTFKESLTNWSGKFRASDGYYFPFILACWYSLHYLKLEDYAEPIDRAVLGAPLNEALQECKSFEEINEWPNKKSATTSLDFEEARKTKEPSLENAPHHSRIYEYGYDGENKIPLYGREREWAKFQNFLARKENFLWVQLAGPAGQGKSRLGWELIQDAKSKLKFNAGFINTSSLENFKDCWSSWKPKEPHLFVIDQLEQSSEAVTLLLLSLIIRAKNNTLDEKVRLIIIERQRRDRGDISSFNSEALAPALSNFRTNFPTVTEAHWFELMVVTGKLKNPSVQLDDPRYTYQQGGVIELYQLETASLIQIIRETANVYSENGSLLYSDSFIAKTLERFDQECSPLFAYFLGLALADNQFQSAWRHGELLSYVLTTEMKDQINTDKDKFPLALFEENSVHVHLAVLATIVGSIDKHDLRRLDGWPRISTNHLENALAIVRAPIAAGVDWPGNTIPSLSPNLLGEWFVLNVFACQPNIQERLISTAADYDLEKTAKFLQRICDDFPDHKVTLELVSKFSKKVLLSSSDANIANEIIYAMRRANIKSPPISIVEVIKKKAKSNPTSMNTLGHLFSIGYGVPQSDRKYLKWLHKAAKLKHKKSLIDLAALYSDEKRRYYSPKKANQIAREVGLQPIIRTLRVMSFLASVGRKTDMDASTIIDELMVLQQQGFVEALLSLGICYEYGIGDTLNPSKASSYYYEAASRNNATAMLYYGHCCEKGFGIPEDTKKAVYWYRKAMDAGDDTAYAFLAVCYLEGIGVEKNETEGIRLLTR